MLHFPTQVPDGWVVESVRLEDDPAMTEEGAEQLREYLGRLESVATLCPRLKPPQREAAVMNVLYLATANALLS